MSNSFLSELSVSVILVILLFLLINPVKFVMPNEVNMLLILGLVISFIIFSAFIFKEKAKDERENLHRYISARFAYLVGMSILVIGIIVQSLNHRLDTWLISTLMSMILAKIAGSIYGRLKH